MEGLRAGTRWALPALLCALLVVIGALEATAAEVVDVRVGNHPTFTRVVFELDNPAGYRIERDSPRAGASVLVVSITATTTPRKVQAPRQSLIGTVIVVPEGNSAVARIELKRSGLRLKEMILTNPPRIVLDVLKPAEAKTAAKPKPTPKPKAVAKPKPTPKPVVKTEPKPAPKPVAKPAPKPVAKAEPPKPPPAPAPKPTATTAKPAIKPPEPSAAPGAGQTRREVVKFAPSDESAPTGAPTGEAKPLAMAKKQTAGAKPPSPRSAPEEEGSGFGMIIVGGLVLLMVVFGMLFVLRRRSAAASDEDEPADEAGEDGFVGGPLTEDENPFAGLGSSDGTQPPLAGSEPDLNAPPKPIDAAELDFGDAMDDAIGDSIGAEPIVEGTSESQPTIEVGGATAVGMEIGGEESAAVGIGAEPEPAVEGEDLTDEEFDEESEEAMRMMRELERRIASLETRCDELTDARERLERQVAAQTEELRVQRAAIARTQRAVRNMTRPDDEGPTEPALRDPS